MDRWVKTHTESKYEGNPDGAMTMGYYTRRELPFHWALADHFTLCDDYHASILGPTHPNRVMSLTGTIDPAGKHGGPITDTNPDPTRAVDLRLADGAGAARGQGRVVEGLPPVEHRHDRPLRPAERVPDVQDRLLRPGPTPSSCRSRDHVLPYFKAFENAELAAAQEGVLPDVPERLRRGLHVRQAAAASRGSSRRSASTSTPRRRHTAASGSPRRSSDSLMSNKKLWAKTALFMMYDENDGWFDHVSPPTAPKGTPGEWLTAKTISPETNGIRGPLGLGVRVPMLVVSPFSRGGHVVS